jgi:hypothetical protein
LQTLPISKLGLRAARHAGQIAWVRGKRGSAWYRPSAIEQFISKELEKPCHDRGPARSSKSVTSGSPMIPDHHSYTDSGLSPELEEHAARALAQQI